MLWIAASVDVDELAEWYDETATTRDQPQSLPYRPGTRRTDRLVFVSEKLDDLLLYF